MAQLVALYLELNTIHTFDGTTYATHKLDKTLFSVTKPYSAAHAWAASLADTILSPHSNVVVLDGNINTVDKSIPTASFKGFHDISGSGFNAMVQAAIVDYVDANSGTINAFKLNSGKMRYFSPADNSVHPPVASTYTGAGNSPMVEFIEKDIGGIQGNDKIHRFPQNKVMLYSMHKSLTVPLV